MIASVNQPPNQSVAFSDRLWQLTLVWSLTTGILSAIFIPPLEGLDETPHFFRVYQCSEGRVYGYKDGTIVGGDLPCSVVTAAASFHGVRVLGDPTAFSLPLDAHRREMHPFPNTILYSPVPYLPASLVIAVGRMANLTPLLLLYGGRIANAITYAVLMSCAVRWMPVQKWTLFLIAMTPMPLVQAGALSADIVTNGAAFLGIAMVLHYAICAERITLRDVAALTLVLTVLALSKQAYCLLTLVFFMIPARKLGSRRQWALAATVVIGVPFLLDLAWSLSVKAIYTPLQAGVNPPAQLRYILHHPQAYAMLLWDRVTVHTLCLDTFNVICLMDVFLPKWVQWFYLATVVTTAVLDTDDSLTLGMQARLISLAVYLLELVGVFTLIYMSWNAVGAASLEGMHPRYLFPVLPLLLLPLRGLLVAILRKYRPGNRIAIETNRYGTAPLACVTVAIATMVSIHTIATFYYH